MTQLGECAARLGLVSHRALVRRADGPNKSAVIGIAAAATVLVVAFIGGLVVWYVKRKKTKKDREVYGRRESVEGNGTCLHDRSSKIPLIRQDEHSEAPRIQNNPTPQYDEDDQALVGASNVPQRTMSGSTTQSLPPSYAAAVQSSTNSEMHLESDHTHDTHWQSSNAEAPSGLRPLLLLNDRHQAEEAEENDPGRGRWRSRSPSNETASRRPLSTSLDQPRDDLGQRADFERNK